MANQTTGGDGASLNWSFTPKQPQLPPKSPSFPNMGLAQPDNGNTLFSSLCNPPYPRANQKQLQRTPSANFPSPATSFPWIDDLLVDATPDSMSKRNSHRRSSSDSAAFLDAPENYGRAEYIGEEDEFDCGSVASIPSRGSQDFDKLDEEQLMSMFADIEPFQKHKNPSPETSLTTMSEKRASLVESPSTTSDQNSANESYEEKGTGSLGGHIKEDSEAQSAHNNNNGDNLNSLTIKGDPSVSTIVTESTLDPKRAKRILANRLSAQRSRVRKLQYISELERSVNALQTEVSTLSPQVAYLDHQRVLLNVDNSGLKQRIAALAQDKLFKDAHYEALKKEVNRLRHIYQSRQQIAYEIPPQEMNKHGMGNTMQQSDSNSDHCESTAEIMKCDENIGHNSIKTNSGSSIMSGKGLEARMLSGSAPVHSDFFV